MSSKDVDSKASPLGGKGLFTNKNVSAGDVIVTVKAPWTSALDKPRWRDTCYHCHQMVNRAGLTGQDSPEGPEEEAFSLKTCTGCHKARFCSEDCQKAAWKQYHKYECRILALLPGIPETVTMLALLRLVLVVEKKNKEKAKTKKEISPEDWTDSFLPLESHIEDFQSAGGEVWEDLCFWSQTVQAISGTAFLEAQVQEITARLMINSFTLMATTYDPVGITFHPLLALINHNCENNAFIRPGKAGTMYLMALKDLNENEEIFISYIDNTYPTRIRKAELKERYFFDCGCQKCTNPSEYELYFNSLTNQRAREILNTESQVADLLKAANKDLSVSGPLRKFEFAIHILHKHGDWPLHRQPFPEVRHEYMVQLLAAEQYNAAFVQAAIQHIYIDPQIMPEPHHPNRLNHEWAFCRLIMYILEGVGWAHQDVILPQGLDLEIIIKESLDNLHQHKHTYFWKTVARNRLIIPVVVVRRATQAAVAREWSKIKRLADGALEKEKAKVFVAATGQPASS